MRSIRTSERLAVLGKTGSGKTLAALWHLSLQPLEAMPWVALDFKRDKTLNKVPGLIDWELAEGAPQDPGLYVVHPLPADEDLVKEFLWDIWKQENTGLYVDEGYMLSPHDEAYNALITQGRSKNIPMITGVQRPAWVSRFMISEAEFIQVFQLNDKRDRQTVQSFFPPETTIERRLPPFHSYYYDVGKDELIVLKPVPSEVEIMESFRAKLPEPEEILPAKRLRFL